MSKTLNVNLSNDSINSAIESLNQLRNDLKKSVNVSVKQATETFKDKVVENCYANNIHDHASNVQSSFDESTNTGKVFTSDPVLAYQERGTGIVGSNNPHPDPQLSWQFDINEHGEAGWLYPKGDGTYGRTSGLTSKHMFYDAANDMKTEFGSIISTELEKIEDNLYVR